MLDKTKALFNHFSPKHRVFFLFFSTHTVALALLDKVTAFAPDEVSYIQVFDELYTKDFDLSPFLGWRLESVNVLRFLYLPARILEFAGFSDFYSVRTLSVLYAFIAFYALLRSATNIRILGAKTSTWISLAFFVPSVFLWTTLGLRESFLILSLTIVFLVIGDTLRINFFARVLLLGSAAIVLLTTKLYLYFLLFVAFVLAILITWISKRVLDKSHVFWLAIFMTPLLIFPTITIGAAVEAKNAIREQFKLAPTPTPTPTPIEVGVPIDSDSESIRIRGETLHSLKEQLDRNPLINWMSEVTGLGGYLEAKADEATVDASLPEAVDSLKSLKTDQASLGDPISLVKGIVTFLFVPTPFVDNDSFFLNILSYESFVWYLFYVLFAMSILNITRRRIRPTISVLTASIFTIEFLVVSSLIETNHGTSVRHRVVFLIGVLAILALSERKNQSAT